MTGGGKATDGTAGETDETDEGEGGAAGGAAGVSLSLERKRAIVLIMKEAFKSYHLAWARSSIEPAFKVRAVRMYVALREVECRSSYRRQDNYAGDTHTRF